MELAAVSASRAERYPAPLSGTERASSGFRSFHDFALSSHTDGNLSVLPTLHPIHISFKAFCRHSLSFPRAGGFIRPQPAKNALHEG